MGKVTISFGIGIDGYSYSRLLSVLVDTLIYQILSMMVVVKIMHWCLWDGEGITVDISIGSGAVQLTLL